MAGFAGRRGSCTAAKCSLSQFSGKFPAYRVHDRDHLIERDELCDACKSHFSSDQGNGDTGSIAVLAGIFYQSANRVTYKSEHIHKDCGSSIGTLKRSASHQLCGSGGSHGSRNTCFCLAAAYSTGNSCISHGEDIRLLRR